MADRSEISQVRTLLKKGSLIAPNGDADLQKKLDQYIPYEYITEWLRKHDGLAGIANRFLIIQAGTASGKSVTIPSEIYIAHIHETYRSSRRGIVCTQPRIITTTDLVRKIVSIPRYAQYLKLGENIGWNTMPYKLKPRHLGLLSATDGTLSAQMSALTDQEIISLYKCIIIDEAHERSPTSDLLFATLKAFLDRNAQNTQCPFIILMSATIDVAKYVRYFGGIEPDEEKAKSRKTRGFSIEQGIANNVIMCRAAEEFPRKHIFARDTVRNVVNETVRIISDILRDHPVRENSRHGNDILVFAAGQANISAIIQGLSKIIGHSGEKSGGKSRPLIVQLTRNDVMRDSIESRTLNLSMAEVSTILGSSYDRRIILATNIAETGITIDSLRYVIDLGFNRENEYNPFIRAETLITKPAAQSHIVQRSGRVGRNFPGSVYHLYTQQVYRKLQYNQLPAILTANITPIILQTVQDQQRLYGTFNIARENLMDNPPTDTILDALSHAYALGFVSRAPDGNGFVLTHLGELAIPLLIAVKSLDHIRAIYSAFAWHYRAEDMISIVAYIEMVGANNPAPRKSAPINLRPIYAQIMPAIGAGEDAPDIMTQWHMFLGDTFCDAIVLARYMDNMYREAKNVAESWDALDKLSQDANISHDALFLFMNRREEIGSIIIEQGYNICANASVIDFRTMMPESYTQVVINYKRALYDGFRANLIYRTDNGSYKTVTGANVIPLFIEKSLHIRATPKYAILNRFRTRASDESVFEIASECMTVLDGFVGPDRRFTQ